MAWLVKVKRTIISNSSFDSTKKCNQLGVIAFEIAGLMSKLLHLWQSLSDKNMIRLRNESISLQGVRKIVSNDDAFLLSLACAEMTENLRLAANSISRLSKQCSDSDDLRSFHRLLDDFSNTGRDPHNWTLTYKDMDSKLIKKLDRLVSSTASLYRGIDELSSLETGYKKCLRDSGSIKQQKMIDKLVWQRQEIKYLKEKSLWSRSFENVTLLLAKSVFTILARIKLVFGINQGFPNSLPRSLSASSAAAVYPSSEHHHHPMISGPLLKTSLKTLSYGFFELNSKILKPPESTLGAAALALHYSNLIIVMEKMIRSPQLVGFDARDDLYSMLPESVRRSLRGRLKGVGFTASDPVLAGEWRDALGKILAWLSPLAHNMIKWQSERSFEQQNYMVHKTTNVLLLQTLYFASQDKTEAAITELLVGLNYIWRFEREMNAKALLEFANFNAFLNNTST